MRSFQIKTSAAAILCEEPETHFERMRGLLGRAALSEGRLMFFRSCRSIHTVGMRFALDVFFLDENGAVVKTVRGLRPGRVALGGARARHTVEAAAGWLAVLPSGCDWGLDKNAR